MNLLPSVLIATTIISGGITTQTGFFRPDAAALQQNKKPCVQGQIIIGNTSDIKALCDELGIQLDELLNGCLPSLPDINPPIQKPEVTPPGDTIPDSTPDVGIPDVETPDTGIPDTETPDTGTPDIETPDIETPDTETPDIETPDIQAPGNGGIDSGQNPDKDHPADTEQTPDKEDTSDTNQTPGTNVTNRQYVKRVVELVNAERAKVNLPALTMSEDLNKAAQIRAAETTKSFSHTRPNGKSFSSVLSENNITFRGAGENIAWGQKTPEAVVNAWMNSKGHRANILNKKFTSIGIGYYLNGSTPYWAQLFTY